MWPFARPCPGTANMGEERPHLIAQGGIYDTDAAALYNHHLRGRFLK